MVPTLDGATWSFGGGRSRIRRRVGALTPVADARGDARIRRRDDVIQRMIDPAKAAEAHSQFAMATDDPSQAPLRALRDATNRLVGDIETYNTLFATVSKDVDGLRRQLAAIATIGSARDALDSQIIREKELPDGKAFESIYAAARTSLYGLTKSVTQERTEVAEALLRLETDEQQAGALSALASSTEPARYLEIAPPVEESRAVEGRAYPDTVPLEEQYMLRVPKHSEASPFAQIKVPTGGGALTVMVVAAGTAARASCSRNLGRCHTTSRTGRRTSSSRWSRLA